MEWDKVLTQGEVTRGLTIAIDGPAGAGKSTVAKLVAQQLHYLYIDSGAMYRAVALAAIRRGISLKDGVALDRLVSQLDIDLERNPAGNRVRLNGEDVTEAIRQPEVSAGASAVAVFPEVRHRLVARQRLMAAGGGVVMDGRDIGSVVLPDADRKFYITASLAERARRRGEQLAAAGHAVDLRALEQEIARRDEQDAERSVAPMVPAADAYIIDTTGCTVEDVVGVILSHCLGGVGA